MVSATYPSQNSYMTTDKTPDIKDVHCVRCGVQMGGRAKGHCKTCVEDVEIIRCALRARPPLHI